MGNYLLVEFKHAREKSRNSKHKVSLVSSDKKELYLTKYDIAFINKERIAWERYVHYCRYGY